MVTLPVTTINCFVCENPAQGTLPRPITLSLSKFGNLTLLTTTGTNDVASFAESNLLFSDSAGSPIKIPAQFRPSVEWIIPIYITRPSALVDSMFKLIVHADGSLKLEDFHPFSSSLFNFLFNIKPFCVKWVSS